MTQRTRVTTKAARSVHVLPSAGMSPCPLRTRPVVTLSAASLPRLSARLPVRTRRRTWLDPCPRPTLVAILHGVIPDLTALVTSLDGAAHDALMGSDTAVLRFVGPLLAAYVVKCAAHGSVHPGDPNLVMFLELGMCCGGAGLSRADVLAELDGASVTVLDLLLHPVAQARTEWPSDAVERVRRRICAAVELATRHAGATLVVGTQAGFTSVGKELIGTVAD